MSQYTNRYGLPSSLVKALTGDYYDAGTTKSDISLTSLIGPPRIFQLRKRHDDKITEDVSDRVWSLLGHAVHWIAEQGQQDHEINEQRLYAEIEGWIISGMSDNYDSLEKVISDYKCTSTWKYTNGDLSEWECQLNGLAFLRRLSGYAVDALRIIPIFRDWSEGDRLRNPHNYPPSPTIVIDMPVWKQSAAESYIRGRVLKHQAAKDLPDDDLPLCTPEERWQGSTFFSVRKQESLRAYRTKPNRHEAQELADALNNPQPKLDKKTGKMKPVKPPAEPYIIEEVTGKPIRCLRFCNVNQFCSFYKTHVEGKYDEPKQNTETEEIES